MPVKNNPVLGYIHCPDCGERGTVHQAKGGKNKYLYKRCGCGCDQRNGKTVQTNLYHNTEWLDGKPERPANVDELPEKPIGNETPIESDEPIDKKEGNMPVVVAAASGAAVLLLALIGKKI